MRDACHYMTYFNHGKEGSECTFLLANPMADLSKLISFKYGDTTNTMCKCLTCKSVDEIFQIPASIPAKKYGIQIIHPHYCPW